MADKKISDLTTATSLGAADYLEIENSGGNSRKILGSNIRDMSGWTELLYYDFSGGAASTKECDVTGYKELLIVGYQLATANSVQRAIQFSTDGGSTWRTTSGDYQDVAATGIGTNNAALFPHTTATTSARDFSMLVLCNVGRIPVPVFLVTRLVNQQFKASATAVNRVRLMGSAAGSGTPDAGNFTSGTFAVYGR